MRRVAGAPGMNQRGALGVNQRGAPGVNQLGTVLAIRQDGLGFDLYEPGGVE